MRAKAGPIQTEKACPSPKVTMLILALLVLLTPSTFPAPA